MDSNSQDWMADSEFEARWLAWETLDDIARANARATETEPPSREAVRDHAQSLGLPARHGQKGA